MKKLIAFSLLVTTTVVSSRGLQGRIVNGLAAYEGEFPYMVYMEMVIGAIKYSCGGCLISSRWVLTAAHCVDSRDGGFVIHTYLGVTFRDNAEIGYALWAPDVVQLHPLYQMNTAQHDIALLEIPETVSCTRISPIQLPPVNSAELQSYDGELGLAIGWGKTSDTSEFPVQLQVGRMEILPNVFCKFFKSWMSNLQMCVDASHTSTCTGDSGGPFVLESTGTPIGIISNSIADSCEAGFPIVLSSIIPHLQWIESITGISY